MYIPDLLHKYGFGVKSLGFDVFELVCAEIGFLVIYTEEKLLEEGLSFPRMRRGKRFCVIVLQKRLQTRLPFLDLLETAWHEFGHACNEHYGVRLFVRGSEDRYERQADDFALCCMIPTLWVRTKKFEELLEEGFTPEQIHRRKYLHDSKEDC